MRRNLVGKKKPQQPKIRWSDTVLFDADNETLADLKAMRDAESDLPSSSSYHWQQMADGSTNQFIAGDHLALASSMFALRGSDYSQTYTSSVSQNAGEISEERNRREFFPATGGYLVADFDEVTDEGTGGSATDVSNVEGDYILIGYSSKAMQIGFDLSGLYSYGGVSRTVATNEYFRLRFKIGSFARFAGSDPTDAVHLRINGTVVKTLMAEEDGVYTWYGRADGSSVDVTLRVPGNTSVRLYYMHVDLQASASSPVSRTDNTTGISLRPSIAVRANGATAYATALDVNNNATLAEDQLFTTVDAMGRDSDKQPGHAQKYLNSAASTSGDGWYAANHACMFPIEDVWAALYADNPSIGSDVDPTAEWYTAWQFNGGPISWTSATQSTINAGTYDHQDYWVKECGLIFQTSVAAVACPAWDGDWSRLHLGRSLFARNTTNDPEVFDYDTYDVSDWSDEPNGFTLEGRGIILGAQTFLELCDRADGSMTWVAPGGGGGSGDPGTVEGRTSDGSVTAGGHDFESLCSGYEFSVAGDEKSKLLANFVNTPKSQEYRLVTYIGESGQNADITDSTISTSFKQWSHAGAIYGFFN